MKKVIVYIIIAVIIMNLFSLSAFAVNEVDYANEETDVSIEELNYSITLDTSKEDKKIQSTASSTSHSFYALSEEHWCLIILGRQIRWVKLFLQRLFT